MPDMHLVQRKNVLCRAASTLIVIIPMVVFGGRYDSLSLRYRRLDIVQGDVILRSLGESIKESGHGESTTKQRCEFRGCLSDRLWYFVADALMRRPVRLGEESTEGCKTSNQYGYSEDRTVSQYVLGHVRRSKCQVSAAGFRSRYLQTVCSTELHIYSHVWSSSCSLKVLTTTTRMIAKTIMKTVREKMPAKASFFRRLIWTFQSSLTGMRITEMLD